jgi:hypothetical protein
MLCVPNFMKLILSVGSVRCRRGTIVRMFLSATVCIRKRNGVKMS